MANLPVPSPRTAQPSEIETGANFNSVRDALNFLLNPPTAVIFQTTVQTLTTGATAKVSFDSTTVDTYGGHSNVTNNTRYTAQVAGYYWFSATVQYNNISGGDRDINILKNGSQVNQFSMAVPASSTAVFPTVSISGEIFLNAGDYLEVQAFQNSGGNVNTQTTGSSLAVDWRHA